MTNHATRSPALIDRQTFWSGLLIGMAFLAGVGFGARIAVHGIRWVMQESTANSNTVASQITTTAEGEAVGKVNLLTTDTLTLGLSDQSQTSFGLTGETTLFEYAGEQAPLLPGENRPQTRLTLADLQPNDMVVIRYASVEEIPYALSIQKIR